MAAIAAEIERAQANPEETREDAFRAIEKLTGAGPHEIFAEAWTHVSFTKDQLRSAVLAFASDACDLGMLPKVPGPALFA